ncbi:hypothetical protein NMG60_11017416 [Bertholletia excelsa]
MAKACCTICEGSSTKAPTLILLMLLGLLLIVPLSARPLNPPSKMGRSSPFVPFHPGPSSTNHKSTEERNPLSPTTATTTTTTTTKGRIPQFEAAAHNVPSGPNPESNR